MTRMRITVAAILAAAVSISACVKVDGELGQNLQPTNQQFETYTVNIPLTETRLMMADSLSGYSSSRITIGAIRDDVFGETERGSAFTLIPALDTVDFGENTVIDGISYPRVKRFHIAFEADTVSTPNGEQERHILQNVDVYALNKPLSSSKGTNDLVSFDASERISDGIPVYAGGDSLSFDFTREFAERYIKGIREVAREGKILITRENAQAGDTVKMADYWAKMPGVYLRIRPGAGAGGRINMFKLSCLTLISENGTTYYSRNGNVATLRMQGVYDGVVKDTAFLFIPGETGFVDEIEAVMKKQKFNQYAFNYTGESTRDREGVATGPLLVEGGGGLKPVIQARELWQKVRDSIAVRGGDPEKAVINLATIYLPFDMPADYRELDLYPTTLSPTCMVTSIDEDGNKAVSFNGLPDAAAEEEDQGAINRSLLRYQPDITWHLQAIIGLKETADPAVMTSRRINKDGTSTYKEVPLSNYDIWLFTIHDEVVESTGSSGYDAEYLQNLMYYQYLNNIYGYGGYGGYGYGGYGYGYGGYGYGYDSYGYSNYYNMMMLNAMYANSGNTATTTATLDKDRYYKAVLRPRDPDNAESGPHLTVTFGIPKE